MGSETLYLGLIPNDGKANNWKSRPILLYGVFLFHLVLATAVFPIITAACLFSFIALISVLAPDRRLIPYDYLTLPLFPLQSVCAFACGLLLARKRYKLWQGTAANFVWIIPAAWLIFVAAGWKARSALAESTWEHFVSSNDPISKRVQILTTMPFLTSAAYAIGVFLGAGIGSSMKGKQVGDRPK